MGPQGTLRDPLLDFDKFLIYVEGNVRLGGSPYYFRIFLNFHIFDTQEGRGSSDPLLGNYRNSCLKCNLIEIHTYIPSFHNCERAHFDLKNQIRENKYVQKHALLPEVFVSEGLAVDGLAAAPVPLWLVKSPSSTSTEGSP